MTLEEEVAALFEQLRNPLFRYLLSLGLTVEDGEEISQDVFMALFQHLHDGKPRDNLRGWTFRVGHNMALKLRHRRRSAVEVEDWDTEADGDPEQQAIAAQWRARLCAVIRALPEQEQSCLALRAEGFRYREIAEILEISLGSVSNAIERAVARLSHLRSQ